MSFGLMVYFVIYTVSHTKFPHDTLHLQKDRVIKKTHLLCCSCHS